MHDAGVEVASFLLSAEEEQRVRIKLSKVREQLKSLSLEHNIDLALLRFETKYPLWEKLPCYIAWFHARVTVDGEIQPCGRCDGNVTFGNLNEGTFHEIWNSPAARAFRRKTLTRKGLAEMSRNCRCSSCCYVHDISRIHRVFRWLRPFAAISWMKD
jgi:radical SAM protein with 4Fe4S-binding SPASM domain